MGRAGDSHGLKHYSERDRPTHSASRRTGRTGAGDDDHGEVSEHWRFRSQDAEMARHGRPFWFMQIPDFVALRWGRVGMISVHLVIAELTESKSGRTSRNS